MPSSNAIIIGAGPAGLTAAYELLERTEFRPIVLEADEDVGGLSKTVEYRGNHLDLGGHRFFSKSDRVMRWWQQILPVEAAGGPDDAEVDITYRGRSRSIRMPADGADPRSSDNVLLVRRRVSRILFRSQLFDYPVSLGLDAVKKLGLRDTCAIVASYARARLAPRPERSLEDFLVNRFGERLYRTFFKDYTEKVWGVACDRIDPDWGPQRVKGLSIRAVVGHALREALRPTRSVEQSRSETSLVERFLYPKLGPGQLWREVARRLEERGGVILRRHRVVGLDLAEGRVTRVRYTNGETSEGELAGDLVFSTMPVRELVRCLGSVVPEPVAAIADGLEYRDFIVVGLLVRELAIRSRNGARRGLVPDNWIYVQERGVKLGRVQIFNNWSPYLVRDPDTVWLGLEYFCNQGDELWRMADPDLRSFAAGELAELGLIDRDVVLDGVVVRVPQAYPAYWGTYRRFDVIREYLSSLDNLYLLGRNGMHRYNNQDHSMLTAMVAVDNLVAGRRDKANIWAVNTELDHIEER
ncbi:MAG TPA: NAD(P)/FAD-dependent oxidoreductase [Candidatus Bathyarchaeia archaeon]|nr:NAD(P)/FAD-dependent oxidoreductase [Candidatus Bathyarchaeia archaeon]